MPALDHQDISVRMCMGMTVSVIMSASGLRHRCPGLYSFLAVMSTYQVPAPEVQLV